MKFEDILDVVQLVEQQLCAICGKSVGPCDHPNAEVTHLACAVEESYTVRGVALPTTGTYVTRYHESCASRKEQQQ